MKTRLSKRVLSVLLAVLMVITSVPMMAFTAFADIDDAVTGAIDDAIQLYELKMDGTVYTNMKAAYDAYLDAKEARDAYVYGDIDVDLNAAAKKLQDATDAMTAFNDPVANATVEKQNSTDVINADYAKNLLYAEKQSEVANKRVTGSWSFKFDVKLYYSPNTIALYDGSDNITIPVTAYWWWDQTSIDDRGMLALYPTDNAENSSANNSQLQLKEAWHGSQNGTLDWDAAWNDGNRIGCYSADVSKTIQQSQSNRKKDNRAANYLKYVGGDSGFTNSLKTITPGWYGYSSKKDSTDKLNVEHFIQNAGTFYIIDYKSFKTVIESKKDILKEIATHREGGFATVLAAFDAATNAANNLTSATPSNVTDRAKALTDAANALNSASATADGTGYQALRTIFDDTIKNVKNTYNNGVNAGYTEESWSAYKTAYENAYGVFFNIMNTSYNNDTQAGTYAKALSDAYDALKRLGGDPVDTTALDIVLSNADYAVKNPELFTTDSFAASNLEAIENECKAAIWGSVENYGNDAAKLDDNDENKAIVEKYRQQLIVAIAALKPNTAKTVFAYDNESLDSILVKAHAVESANYSNYEEVLVPAITAGEAFISNPTSIDATVANAVQNGVVEYQKLVADIYSAMKNLLPAFSAMPNGTLANAGTEVSTKAQAWQNGGYEKNVNWVRNNNQIVFKTIHGASTFDLGASRLEFYNSVNYDNHFDSINLNDQNSTTGELKDGVTNEADSATDVTAYPGGLTVTVNSGTFALSNIYVTSASSDILGHDGNGGNVTDPSFDFAVGLSGSSGKVPTEGAITAKNGTTYASTKFTLAVGATPKRDLSLGTVPEKQEYNVNNYFGMLYWYKHKRTATSYYGYAHGRTAYTQNVTVIDISYLIDAINEYGKISPVGYTTASYKRLTDALKDAKEDLKTADGRTVEDMTADEILKECKDRYNELYIAQDSLVPCASNAALKQAIADTQTTYLLGNVNYSPASWSTFTAAYEEAKRALENEYSDANISNIAQANQSAVDAVAQALLDAYAGLVSQADFQPVYDAAQALADSLADKKFTVASLEALNAALAGFTYLNMTEDDKKNVYAESNDAIKAEAAQISALTANEAIVDASTLEAAVAKAKAEYSDPDAWQGVAEAIAKIGAINIYDDVTVYGKTVVGVKYDTQSDLDVEVTGILSAIAPQTYTVYVNGVAQGTYAYGTEATVSADESVAWYYDYISNTANTSNTGSADSYSGKYYTTDRLIRFIVKGDTYLTTKSASDTADTVKVSYANALKNKTYAVDYVEVGSTVTLETAPAVAYYDFAGYTVDGTDYAVGDTITVNSDTVVVANYELSNTAEAYEVEMIFTNAANTKKAFIFTGEGGLYYNDLLEISTDNMKQSSNANRTYSVNGTSYKYAIRNNDVSYKMGADTNIYAWAMVPEEVVYGEYPDEMGYEDVIMGAFYEEYGEEKVDETLTALLAGTESIVNYGANYSFYVHSNMVLLALTKEDYDKHLANGLINTTGMDDNSASVTASDNLVITDTKFSMITTYALPEGAELVEGGILFTQDQAKDIASFNEVGNGVNRLKSSQHTVGNQFVISVTTTKLASGATKTFAYAGYVTYKLNGKTYTVFSNPVFKTNAVVKN